MCNHCIHALGQTLWKSREEKCNHFETKANKLAYDSRYVRDILKEMRHLQLTYSSKLRPVHALVWVSTGMASLWDSQRELHTWGEGYRKRQKALSNSSLTGRQARTLAGNLLASGLSTEVNHAIEKRSREPLFSWTKNQRDNWQSK